MFIKGMDISSYPEMMDKGHRYYDFDGNEVNIIDYAKAQGFNYGRLRIWNNPERIKESGGYCNLTYTKRMAREIMSRGMGLLLDFHYSDWWADPGNQKKPLEWNDLNGEDLNKAVYDYTKTVLLELDKNGTYPTMVQIGNEIRCGMLWPNGSPGNWKEFADLINSGIRAVRDTQKGRDTQIMLHLDQGGRFYYFKEWFDQALAHGVTDFDVIGLSYYPFWHGTFYDLKNTMEELVKRYHKPLIIAETAHAYCRSKGKLFGEAQEKIAGFPANGEAQKKVLELIMSITAHVSDHKGLGIFYWEPFLRPNDNEDDDSWGSCMGIVDKEGRPTLGIKAFGSDPESADIDKNAKIYEPAAITVTENDDPAEYLPQAVKVLKYDGRLEKEKVTWEFEKAALIKNDINVINGVLSECGQPVTLHIGLVDKKEENNLLKNTDFESIFEGIPEDWEISVEAEQDSFTGEIRQEVEEEFPFQATNYYYFKAEGNFKMLFQQRVYGMMPGTYLFSLLYRGDNTTGVDVKMYVKEDGRELAAKEIFPSAEGWTEHRVCFALADNTVAEVGVEITAPAIYGEIKGMFLRRDKSI